MPRTRLAELCFTCTLVLGAVAAPAQTFNTLHTFDYTDGANPYYVCLVQGQPLLRPESRSDECMPRHVRANDGLAVSILP